MNDEIITNNGNHPEHPKFITKPMAAKNLGLSEYAISKLVKSGVLKRCEGEGFPERPWFFTQAHLDDLIHRMSAGIK